MYRQVAGQNREIQEIRMLTTKKMAFCVLASLQAGNLFVQAATAPVVPADSVVNNASFATGTNPLAPGTIAAIFGTNLDDGSNDAFSAFGKDGKLLTTLGGASVTFNGISASMFSSFPGQLNVQIPPELTGTSASVVVTVGGQKSAPQTVALDSLSPGIFSTSQSGTGQGVIQIANTTIFAAAAGSIPGAQTRAVKPGEFITIYCTGLGAVDNPPAPGTAASDNPLSHTKVTPQVSIGGAPATVSFAGLSPGFVGLYQVNVQIPADAPGGSAVTVALSIGGIKSNTVTIAIAGIVGSKIAAGESHTCAVTGAGAVLCWGLNQYGQLGNGTTTDSLTPVPVTGLTSGVVAITAGQNFNCALTKAGTVMCWGFNVTGNLGNGTDGGVSQSTTPVEVLDPTGKGSLSGIVAIAAGQYHTCAITSAGEALCWGDNAEGELGIGSQPQSPLDTPQAVTGLSSGVSTITGGSYFTCAATSSGAARCWGTALSGVLGAGNSVNGSFTPVPVVDPAGNAPLSGVAAVSAGYENACALTNKGAVLCWGNDSAGQLGNGTDGSTGVNESNVPVEVLDLTGKSPLGGVVAVTGGLDDNCALTSAGAVLCWGLGHFGELGNNNGEPSKIPVQVSGLTSGVTEIASGYHHNCAVTSSGGMLCWGFNLKGQLGTGKTAAELIPVAVVGVGGAGLLKLF
jgi:uncharacterized protein (TIGR03437 family)